MCAIYECFNLFAYLDWTEVMQSCHSFCTLHTGFHTFFLIPLALMVLADFL